MSKSSRQNKYLRKTMKSKMTKNTNKTKKTVKNYSNNTLINKMSGGVLSDLYFKTILEDVSNNIPTLTEINIRREYCGEEKIKALAEALENNKTVKMLNITENDIGIEGVKAIAKLLSMNKTLTNLNISYNQIGEKGMIEFAEILLKLGGNQTLTYLNISENNIGPTGLFNLIRILNKMRLKTLDINYNDISLSAYLLGRALGNNITITTLNIGSNQLNDNNIKDLVEGIGNIGLKNNSTLTSLNMYNNHFGNIGAKYIAKLLVSEKSALTSLNLSSNRIGDAGAIDLAEALKTNTKLANLLINENEITDIGINAFANTLNTNKTLITFEFDDNDNKNIIFFNFINKAIVNNRKKLINNVSTLAPLYSSETLEDQLLVGIYLQNAYINGNTNLQYNNTNDRIILNKENLTKNHQGISIKKAITFFKNMLPLKTKIKNNKNNNKKTVTKFFKKNSNINDEVIFTFLLYIPLIKSFVNNKELIYNLRHSNNKEILHYIEIFDQILKTKYKRPTLSKDIWDIIISYLSMDDLVKIRIALTL